MCHQGRTVQFSQQKMMTTTRQRNCQLFRARGLQTNHNRQTKMFNDVKVWGLRPSQTDKVSHFLIRFLKSEFRYRVKKGRLNHKGTKSFNMVRMPTRSIRNCLLTTKIIHNMWIDISKPFNPSTLPSIQLWLGWEVNKRLVIYITFRSSGTTNYIWMLLNSIEYNSQQLTIAHGIVLFSRIQLLAEELQRLRTIPIILL